MKATQLSYVLLCTLASASFMQGRTACPSPATVVLPQASCSSNVVLISQADINNTLTSGYTITLPGRYCLTEDITWTPILSGVGDPGPVAGISILSSNVELDLNGYTFQQSGTANFTAGIMIGNQLAITDTPLSNIIVKNGTVQNITTVGILVDLVNDLLLEDLYVLKNGASGSFLCACGANRAGGVVFRLPAPFVNPATGTQSPLINNIILRNVHGDFNGGNGNTPVVGPIEIVGAFIERATSVLVQNCTFNNNFITPTTSSNISSAVSGLLLMADQSVLVENSSFNSNNGTQSGSTAAGTIVQLNFGTGNISYANCNASANVSNANVYGFACATFYLTDLNYYNCRAQDNFLTGIAPATTNNQYTVIGFDMASSLNGSAFNSDITFINCIASNQNSQLTGSPVPVYVEGFVIEGTNYDCILENCIANDNGSDSFGIINIGRGFHISGALNGNNTLKGCLASNNLGNDASYQYDIEFVDYLGVFGSGLPTNTPVQYINLIDCTAGGFPFVFFGLTPNGAGIHLRDAQNCVVERCLLEGNLPDGILIEQDTLCYTRDNIIKHNQITTTIPGLGNSGGATGVWGIEDTSGDGFTSFNTYYDNYSWNYFGNVPGLTNYSTGVRTAGPGSSVFAPDPVYLWTWNIPGGPISYTGAFSKISNADIINGPCVLT